MEVVRDGVAVRAFGAGTFIAFISRKPHGTTSAYPRCPQAPRATERDERGVVRPGTAGHSA
jgi:hypothetical protein